MEENTNAREIDTERTGENIKMLMDRKKITVKMVKESLNLGTTQAVYKWIHGQSLPSVDNLVILSQILEVSIDDIIILKQI